jgi:hypothetical protein
MFAESGAKVVLADIDGHLAAKEAERIVAEGGTASPATLPMRRSPRWSIAQDAIERICSAEFSDRPLVAVADPGVNVHFRLAPTLYTAFITTIGVTVALATLPANPMVAGGAAGLAVVKAIKDVAQLFNKLNAQEVAVVNGAFHRRCRAAKKRLKSKRCHRRPGGGNIQRTRQTAGG